MEDGKTNPTGLVQSMQMQEHPGSLLGAPAIGRLVRQFIAEVLDALDKARREGLTRDAGAAVVEASSRYFAGVMTGRIQREGFSGGGDWLERGLPHYLREHHGIGSEGEEAIAEAFAKIAKRVFQIVTRPLPPEPALDRLVASSVALFGGMGGDAAVSKVAH